MIHSTKKKEMRTTATAFTSHEEGVFGVFVYFEVILHSKERFGVFCFGKGIDSISHHISEAYT